jgi:hypothetical protein
LATFQLFKEFYTKFENLFQTSQTNLGQKLRQKPTQTRHKDVWNLFHSLIVLGIFKCNFKAKRKLSMLFDANKKDEKIEKKCVNKIRHQLLGLI